jgi:hypothetical protein
LVNLTYVTTSGQGISTKKSQHYYFRHSPQSLVFSKTVFWKLGLFLSSDEKTKWPNSIRERHSPICMQSLGPTNVNFSTDILRSGQNLNQAPPIQFCIPTTWANLVPYGDTHLRKVKYSIKRWAEANLVQSYKTSKFITSRKTLHKIPFPWKWSQ